MSWYFEPDPEWLRSGTTSIPVIRPSLANSIAPTSGVGAWVLGAYVQLAAAADLTSHSMIGMIFFAFPDTQYQVEVASGGAGAEVVFWRFPVLAGTNAGPGLYSPCVPAAQVPASARVAVRIASVAGA